MSKTPKQILLIEDNHLEAGEVQERLKLDLSGFELSFTVCATEQEFREKLAGSGLGSLDLAIIDIILPWAALAPDMPPMPADVKEGGNARAGIRCKKMLLENEATKAVPIILYSYLDEGALSAPEVDGAKFVSKMSDPAELVAEVRKRLTSDLSPI